MSLIGVACRPHFWPRPRPQSHSQTLLRVDLTSAVAWVYSGLGNHGGGVHGRKRVLYFALTPDALSRTSLIA